MNEYDSTIDIDQQGPVYSSLKGYHTSIGKLNSAKINCDGSYEKERNTRFYDSIDYKGRIKIGYRPQDMGAFSEKIENQESLKYNKLEKGEIEFIPRISIY